MKPIQFAFMMLVAALGCSASLADSCTTRFGQVLGKSYATYAYSNCHDDEQPTTMPPLESGIRWQCVEFARRWWNDQFNMTFASVDFAYQIWNLKDAVDLKTHLHHRLVHFKNRHTQHLPQRGDLLIYDKSLVFTGHVAVVVGVQGETVFIAEQNYFNELWENPNYARRALILTDENHQIRVVDEGLVGWVRVKPKSIKKTVDQPLALAESVNTSQ